MKKLAYFFVFIFLFVNLVNAQASLLDSLLNSISTDSLKLYTRQLSGDTSCIIGGSPYTILSRNKNQPGNQKAAEYIYEKFQSFGLTANYETFSSTGVNVIGTKTGTHFPNRYYVICAHYDDMPSGTTAPGADDNASGTAAVIEIARVFSKFNFQYTIKFMGFDEEEQGLIGSNYYATQARNRNDTILGVINLDMIAYHSAGTNIINVHTKNVANSQEIGADVVENISTFGLGLNPVIVPSQPYSDHDSFLKKGYGAILIIEDDNNFNPYYHTVNDKFMYVNMPYFYKITKVTAVTIAKYAMNLNIAIDHIPIASTNSTTPNTAIVNIISGLNIGTGVAAPRLYYRVDSGTGFGPFNSVVDNDGPIGSQYEFVIPAQLLGTIVEYYVAVQDEAGSMVQTLPSGGTGVNPPGSNPPNSFYRYYVANQLALFNNDCSSLSRWTSASLWGITTGSFVSPPASITDSPAGSYPSSTINILTMKDTISLNNILGARLKFSAKWELEDGYDYVQVMITSNFGTTWTSLTGKYTKPGAGSFQPSGQPLYNGTQTSWVNDEIDLTSYLNKNIQIRYYFRSDGSVVKDGFYVDDVQIIVYEAGTGAITTTINTENGWNLVSLPVAPLDNLTSTLFPSANSSAYAFQSGAYSPKDSLFPRTGYWIKFSGVQEHTLNGTEISNLSIQASTGWNLIGTVNSNVMTANIITIPEGILASKFYEFNSGYQHTKILQKGKGYWIKVSENGLININSSYHKGNIDPAVNEEKFNDIITITDNEGNATQLYLTESISSTGLFDLPPIPPTGIFDVRYSNNKYVGILSDVNTILLNYVKFPINISFESDKNYSLNILSDNSSFESDFKLLSSSSITINQPVNKLKIKTGMTPTEFKLDQNYPNPFNAKSNVKYSIPSDGLVELTIFNTLGQRVAEVVNEFKTAGTYNADIDGTNLASGVYLIKLKFENNIITKKGILLK